MNEIVVVAAGVLAGGSLLVAIGTAWALGRLRRHHRALARSFEEQQLQIAKVPEQTRDGLREVERRGERALVERFALHEAAQARRDRVRSALEEVVAAAATGELDAQATRVLVAHLHQIDRELGGPRPN
jgi:hypothetical protein